MKAKLFILSVALISLGATVIAQSPVKKQTTTTKKVQVNNQQSTTQQQGRSVVDTNSNKLCDSVKTNNVRPARGQGLRDGSGRGLGRGLRNGTGRRACVNGTGGAGVGNGTGKRDGSGKGVGNFVDANKNGVCDLKEK